MTGVQTCALPIWGGRNLGLPLRFGLRPQGPCRVGPWRRRLEALKARRYQLGIFQALLPDWGQDKSLGSQEVGRAANCGMEAGITVG